MTLRGYTFVMHTIALFVTVYIRWRPHFRRFCIRRLYEGVISFGGLIKFRRRIDVIRFQLFRVRIVISMTRDAQENYLKSQCYVKILLYKYLPYYLNKTIVCSHCLQD